MEDKTGMSVIVEKREVNIYETSLYSRVWNKIDVSTDSYVTPILSKKEP